MKKKKREKRILCQQHSRQLINKILGQSSNGHFIEYTCEIIYVGFYHFQIGIFLELINSFCNYNNLTGFIKKKKKAMFACAALESDHRPIRSPEKKKTKKLLLVLMGHAPSLDGLSANLSLNKHAQ